MTKESALSPMAKSFLGAMGVDLADLQLGKTYPIGTVTPPPYQTGTVEAFRTMQHAIHQNAVEHGWWDEPREDGTVLALVHAEVSECLEALREGNPPDKQCPWLSQAEVELADVVIRIMDFCERKGWALGRALVAKHEFNKSRPFMHGGKEF